MSQSRSRAAKGGNGASRANGQGKVSPPAAVKEEPQEGIPQLAPPGHLLPPAGRSGKTMKMVESEKKGVVSLPDVWSRKYVSFTSVADGHKALQDEQLLGPFFNRWGEVTRALEVTCAGVNTDLCNDIIASRKITVLVYGEAGAGKSTLVKALTHDSDILAVSATGLGTVVETEVGLPCGLRLVDTPGFRVPLPLRSSASSAGSVPMPGAAHPSEGGRFSLAWIREVLAWRAMLRSLHSRLTSQDARLRPFALIYCHRAGARILKERVVELLRVPHMKLVPVFTVLTDVTNADDDDLVRIRAEWGSLLDDVGANAKGARVQLVEVNSFAKTVRGHAHRQTGVKELMSLLLNSLDPLDALTFARMPGIFTPARKRKRTDDMIGRAAEGEGDCPG